MAGRHRRDDDTDAVDDPHVDESADAGGTAGSTDAEFGTDGGGAGPRQAS